MRTHTHTHTASRLGGALHLINKQRLRDIFVAGSRECDGEGEGAGGVVLHLRAPMKLHLLLLQLREQRLNLVATDDGG